LTDRGAEPDHWTRFCFSDLPLSGDRLELEQIYVDDELEALSQAGWHSRA
jgi:hypothetical protein